MNRLRRELAACEEALQAQRTTQLRLHDDCERLRGAKSELSQRLQLEEARNAILLDAGQQASARAQLAARELVASRRENVELTASLGARGHARGAAVGGKRRDPVGNRPAG